MACAAVAALAAGAPRRLRAQERPPTPPVQPEFRADLLVRDRPAVDVGGGLIVRAGYYARIAFLAGAGAEWRDQRAGGSAHVDVVSRFLLDPFREVRWGLYGGGGASLRWSPGARAQPYLLLVAGVEGPERGGWRPAFEAGLGGGVRVAMVLRRARPGAR